MSEIEILRLTIPGDPKYIKIATMAVGQAAANSGLDIEKTDDLQVAVGEACRLISCHGFPGWSENYSVIFCTDEEKVSVCVIDDNGKHTKEKSGDCQCLDCPNEGDIGIKVIECVTDEVEITRAQTGCRSIKITKNKI